MNLTVHGIYPSHRASKLPSSSGILVIYRFIKINWTNGIVETARTGYHNLKDSLDTFAYTADLASYANKLAEDAPSLIDGKQDKNIAFAYITGSGLSEDIADILNRKNLPHSYSLKFEPVIGEFENEFEAQGNAI